MTRKARLDQGEGEYSTYDAIGRSTLHAADGTVLVPEDAQGFEGPNHTYSVFRDGAWQTISQPDPNQKFAFQPRATFGGGGEVTGAGFTNRTNTIPSVGDPPQMFWVDENGNPGLPPGNVAGELRDGAAVKAAIVDLLGKL
jgi:hypothetical protein